uniref:Uncharacterized protein n=1 Tax=Arundo donax TaxID=35708 RepID=A0A0A9A9H7_ARUDO
MRSGGSCVGTKLTPE